MKKTLNLGGRILDLSEPKIMGVLNATPDSFYAKSRVGDGYKSVVDKMIADRVDILDVGGYSTRPGASEVSVQEEIDRVLPIVEYISSNHQECVISLDSFRHNVVLEVSKLSPFIVNDVSGGNLDAQMWLTVSKLKLPYILMHMRGNPSTMQSTENTTYENVVVEVIQQLQAKIVELQKLDIYDVLIDPGIGFAKKVQDNFELIKSLNEFHILEVPLLLGISRKSFIWKTLNTTPEMTLPSSTAIHALALNQGVKILRVHDVHEAVQVRDLFVAGKLIQESPTV